MLINNKPGKTIPAMIVLAVFAAVIPTTDTNASDSTLAKRNTASTKGRPMARHKNKTLVIYFSRSGKTELMAKEIAKSYPGSLAELKAEDYRLGVLGLVNAVKDSRSKHATITPDQLDLSPYQTIFIGAPIWWYSPAPPVWQFVENNNLVDKNVVLFTTFNSSFEQKHIDEFQAQVEGKGGHFVKHIYVKRGRITQQVSDNALLEQTRKALNNLQYE